MQLKKSFYTKEDLKPKFVERYREICPDYNAFIESSFKYLRKSIRINTLKISIKKLKENMPDWIFKEIPWCDYGFFIEHKEGRRDIGNTIQHSLGQIYVQEAVSMIPPIVLDPKSGDIVLDMCASPGSKTTQLAQIMKNKGLIIANDIKGDRIAALGINIQRCGITNCIVTQMHGQSFGKKGILFDKILVDAPCSATGAIRKSFKTVEMWNPNMIKRLSQTQKSLIKTAFNLLKPNGTLVYSTCSVEPEEDEEVVDYLINEFDNAKVEEIKINIKKGKPILKFENKSYSKEVKKTLRIWPQDNDTEGFFIAKIRKL
ncbi:NOL1/NOP2/sun family putative RNA methylase [Candidatus Woesearchaeota archaeon]|nr:NOL1/NOP2/sun family putative RNA methylase [Candidatus Woesearchaeota archaeon]